MKVCVAQTSSIKGDIQENINRHIGLIKVANRHQVDVIIFPELSLTGYEPALASELAIEPDDHRLNAFQMISDEKNVTIGVGIPTRATHGICISMILFQPRMTRQLYSKRYLHPDEEPFFVPGKTFTDLKVKGVPVALAICYELSVPEHTMLAFENGAKIYIASVAKSITGVEKAVQRLSEIAVDNTCSVFMSNALGFCDNFYSAGKSSVWNSRGQLLYQLDDVNEGILIFDTDSEKIIEEKPELALANQNADATKRQP
jgi:predicted amidohydrolase